MMEEIMDMDKKNLPQYRSLQISMMKNQKSRKSQKKKIKNRKLFLVILVYIYAHDYHKILNNTADLALLARRSLVWRKIC